MGVMSLQVPGPGRGRQEKMTVSRPRRADQLLSLLTMIFVVIFLLFYALYWKHGNLIDLPDQRIGFFNFCLWDEEAGSLHCHKSSELEALGVSQAGLALARFGVYAALVFTLFTPLSLVPVWSKGDKGKWQPLMAFLVIASTLLAGGLSLFFTCARKWITVSLLGLEFLALAIAQALLILLLMATVMFSQREEKDKKELESCYASPS